MPFICFKCKNQLPLDAKLLINHLRRVHHINQSATYFQCCELGCGRTFSFLRSFRSHLLEHSDEQDDYKSYIPHESTNQTCEFQQAEEGSAQEDTFWDDLDEKGISERVALYLANLRSRSNLTFTSLKFVVNHTGELINDIVGHLQTKTMALLSALGQAHTPEALSFQEEFSSCSAPFKGLETDYKQMEYFSNSACG